MQSFADGRKSPQARHVGLHRGLVDEHQPVGLFAHPVQAWPDPVPPGMANVLSSCLGRDQRLSSTRHPPRRRARPKDASSARTPVASSSARASIEAAWVGEAGTGFAVIAREIGSLSEEVQASRRDVATRLDAIMDRFGAL